MTPVQNATRQDTPQQQKASHPLRRRHPARRRRRKFVYVLSGLCGSLSLLLCFLFPSIATRYWAFQTTNADMMAASLSGTMSLKQELERWTKAANEWKLQRVDKTTTTTSSTTTSTTTSSSSTMGQQEVASSSPVWKIASIQDYGAIGDNRTDNTLAFQRALQDITNNFTTGGELIIPYNQTYQTYPINLTSHVVLTVYGNIVAIPNRTFWPIVQPLPSYGRDADLNGKLRRHPFIHSIHSTNVTIRGSGTIDGGGWYWYPDFFNSNSPESIQFGRIGRPHLMEFNNVSEVHITGVTWKNSAFWTLHPVYCTNVHIHHITILAPSCRNYLCPNTDGIDIDSSQNVLVEYNTIDVGDDHVTVLAGKLRPLSGIPRSPLTRNITVQHNTLLSGMGLSIGSSTAGGVQDVLYYNNTMREEVRVNMGQGIHIKVRNRYGGFIKNISWIDNVFYVAGKPGGAIKFEAGYQSSQRSRCTNATCTRVSDILIRNLTVHDGNPGSLQCYPQLPCENIVLEDVRFINDANAKIQCANIASGSVKNIYPEGLLDPNSCSTLYHDSP